MKEALIALFERDIDKLATELSLYANEHDIWALKGEISNSAGNLCLHLIGNLNHFIGAVLGETGYLRNREAEFSTKDVSIAHILTQIEATKATVTGTLQNLSTEDMDQDFPVAFLGKVSKTGYVLLHLLSHLSYHLGQINYHRRLVSS